LLGIENILVKNLYGALQKIKGISGASILGGRQVVLVLDVGQFVNSAQKKILNAECESTL
jgi:chemotaxis protein histidine kinase CheA